MKSFKRLSTVYISFLLSTEIFVVAAKSSIRPTIDDDKDYIHRLQTTLGVTRERFLRGGNRNLLVKADKNTISINKKNGNKMKTEGQQYREMERKDSNIFVHKGTW
jgi:hypothetical protein